MKALTVVPWGPAWVIVVTTATVLLIRAIDSLKSMTKASGGAFDMFLLDAAGIVGCNSRLAPMLGIRLSAGYSVISDIRSEVAAESFGAGQARNRVAQAVRRTIPLQPDC